jgi:hypothetical protein
MRPALAHTSLEELACVFRVAVGEELHRALEIGEQHRDLLPLAFERGLRGEDLLGEVPRGVRLWGGRPNWGRGVRGDGLAALKAEAGAPG